jgi:H+/Cl- antiporter ClcA
MNQQTGKLIVFAGIVLIIAGLIIYFFYDKFHWFGRLPGDIRIEKENTRIYFPWVTMLLLSLVLNLLIYLFRKITDYL